MEWIDWILLQFIHTLQAHVPINSDLCCNGVFQWLALLSNKAKFASLVFVQVGISVHFLCLMQTVNLFKFSFVVIIQL